jgi:hypothetical protein
MKKSHHCNRQQTTNKPIMLEKIVSGGQTGADRAGLDAAIRWDLPHGGWCPLGRRAEDGPISSQYNLVETPDTSYLWRTEWNVRDSDGTVVFTLARRVTGGSKRTIHFANQLKKPCKQICMASYRPVEDLRRFVARHGIRVLNVAGSSESKEPGIWLWTFETLEAAFFWDKAHPNTFGGPDEG